MDFTYVTTSVHYNLAHFLEESKCIRNFNNLLHEIEIFNTPITKDCEYVDHILEMMRGFEPNLTIKNFCKSPVCAKQYRKEGNEKYAKKEFYGAFKSYTKSIAFAVNRTEDLGLAYANRSAVLLEREYYKECLEFGAWFVFEKHPVEEWKFKSVEVQKIKNVVFYQKLSLCAIANCIQNILSARLLISSDMFGAKDGALSKFTSTLWDIERALQNKYPEDKKEKLYQRRDKATSAIESTKKILYHTVAPNLPSKNDEILSASASVKIQNGTNGTKKIIAKNKIKAGEIILIENPFVAVASCYRTVRYIHCNECMELCFNMIPCEKCPFALYCSVKCRRDAFIKFHRYECPILQIFGYSVPHLLFLRLTLHALKEYTNVTDSTTSNVFTSNRYKEFNYLKTKEKYLTPKVRLKLAIMPALFYRMLSKTDLLLEYDFENNHTVLKEMLVKNALLSIFNARHIEKYSNLMRSAAIGTGIFTVFNFFNHSCVHNVDTTFYGTTLALYARKNIKVGEECFVNFGCSYIDMNKALRDVLLEASFTKCSCRACTNNWPTRAELMNHDFKVCTAFLDLNRDFDNGKITNKQKFLTDCCRYFNDLKEVEWSLNKMILNTLITKCICSMGNNAVPF